MAVYQRVDQAGQKLPIDERILADTDTLMIFGLDHMVTEQEAAPEEIEALRAFLAREGTCLILGPHHDVGASDDLKERNVEYAHHGDPLVPRQQRFGRYTRSLMSGLGVPVQNQCDASNKMMACAVPPAAASRSWRGRWRRRGRCPVPSRPGTRRVATERRGAGEAREDDDQREAEQQGALAADPAGDEAGDQHRDAHDRACSR